MVCRRHDILLGFGDVKAAESFFTLQTFKCSHQKCKEMLLRTVRTRRGCDGTGQAEEEQCGAAEPTLVHLVSKVRGLITQPVCLTSE